LTRFFNSAVGLFWIRFLTASRFVKGVAVDVNRLFLNSTRLCFMEGAIV
jgi:hypothetical protein